MRFPVFPLNGAILFPSTNLPLNIFEERYIDMVDYALSNNRLIGMIQKRENGELFNIGCFGKITSFNETDDGRYQITLQGLDRYFLKKNIKSDYKFLLVDANILETKNTVEEKQMREKLLFSFKKFLKIKKINFNTSGLEGIECSSLAKLICVISPLDYLIKQMLLEFNDYEDLCQNLLSVLEIEMQNFENPKIN